MKSNLKKIQLLLIVLFVSTVTFAQTHSDFDKSVDFSKYKTYSIAGWVKGSEKSINDFDKERIITAIKAEYASRGITFVESGGDAVITLYISIDNKTSLSSYTDYTGGLGYGGYGGRWGYGYGGMGGMMGSSTTTYTEDDYKEGTFVIDMYSAADKKLLWQGVNTSVVKENPKKREKSIPKHIAKMFYKYPIKPLK